MRDIRETTAAVNWMHDATGRLAVTARTASSRGRFGELQREAARRTELAVAGWGVPDSALTTQSASLFKDSSGTLCMSPACRPTKQLSILLICAIELCKATLKS